MLEFLVDQSEKATNPRYNMYPETISFTGIGHASLKSIHMIAGSLVVLGLVFAMFSPPGGYIVLGVFILVAAGYDIVFIRKSQKPVRLTLHLRRDPVQATMDERVIGDIVNGSIDTEMENPNELGYRPSPKKGLLVWTFDSESDARIVAKRLLEYLPRETENQ